MTRESVTKAASALATRPDVASRINVLKGRATAAAVKNAALTLEDCLAEAGEMLQDAKALGNTSAGVAAAKLRAQLAGHLVERKEVKDSRLDDATVDNILDVLKELKQRAAAAAEADALVGGEPEAIQATVIPIRRVS